MCHEQKAVCVARLSRGDCDSGNVGAGTAINSEFGPAEQSGLRRIGLIDTLARIHDRRLAEGLSLLIRGQDNPAKIRWTPVEMPIAARATPNAGRQLADGNSEMLAQSLVPLRPDANHFVRRLDICSPPYPREDQAFAAVRSHNHDRTFGIARCEKVLELDLAAGQFDDLLHDVGSGDSFPMQIAVDDISVGYPEGQPKLGSGHATFKEKVC